MIVVVSMDSNRGCCSFADVDSGRTGLMMVTVFLLQAGLSRHASSDHFDLLEFATWDPVFMFSRVSFLTL